MKKKFFKLFVPLSIFLAPKLSLAASDFSVVEMKLSDYYRHLFVPLGVFLAAVVVVIGGAMYASSQGDPQRISRAKELMVGAFIGLAILLSAGYIISMIVG